MTYYERIKQLRISKGMTQEELAHKVGYSDKTAVNKVEMGLRDIPQSKICAFADALGVTASYLMDGDVKKDLVLTDDECRLIMELREHKDIDAHRLEIMFNTILRHIQEQNTSNPINVTEPLHYEIRLQQFLPKNKNDNK